MDKAPATPQTPRVGILVLNYHHPEDTLACVRRLLEVEGPQTRVLWIENDAAITESQALEVLRGSGIPWIRLDPAAEALPEAGCVGFIPVPENLGYAGGNDVGLRLLHRLGVEFSWVLNNDTLLTRGSSSDLIRAAEADGTVGLWGMRICTDHFPMYRGGVIQTMDFSIRYATEIRELEEDPLSYVSGCAMFFRTALAATLGFIPEDYFLYYEDQAFSLEFRRNGHRLSAVDSVEVLHNESLSTGRHSPLMEYYIRRNRWLFIHRYFPDHEGTQKRQYPYILQKWLFRGKWTRLQVEMAARRDYLAGHFGRTGRSFGTGKGSA